jgi:hypothetical protein
MELIFESQQRMLFEGAKIPAHIRMASRKLLQLVQDEHPYVGWKCEIEEGSFPRFLRDDCQKLEDDVVAKIIGRRQAE